MSTQPSAATAVETSLPPRTIHDEKGAVVGVILAVGDYTRFLHLLAERSDGDDLPAQLQDAVDNLVADEAEADGGEPSPGRATQNAFAPTASCSGPREAELPIRRSQVRILPEVPLQDGPRKASPSGRPTPHLTPPTPPGSPPTPYSRH